MEGNGVTARKAAKRTKKNVRTMPSIESGLEIIGLSIITKTMSKLEQYDTQMQR